MSFLVLESNATKHIPLRHKALLVAVNWADHILQVEESGPAGLFMAQDSVELHISEFIAGSSSLQTEVTAVFFCLMRWPTMPLDECASVEDYQLCEVQLERLE